MGYRGSKSVLLNGNSTVKEQRVDGSWQLFNSKGLRFTLMGFERNYRIRIPSNKLDKKIRFYSTTRYIINQTNLNPWFLTGFIDGEGCFRIALTKIKREIGWRVQLFFQINLHSKDRALLESIKNFLDVGQIQVSGKNLIQYRIQTLDEITVFLKHLDKYPLITKKKADYLLFKEVYELVKLKKHLTKDGLLKIVSLKASLNLGLSKQLKAAFPNIIPATRNTDYSISIPNCNWLSGFVTAEGCFMVGLSKSKMSTGYQIYLSFIITQHIRDELLMKNLIDYLGCGKLTRKRDVYEFQIFKFIDITDKIIVFFEKYPILGDKAKDFSDFCYVADLMKNKVHLTEDGVAKIQKIKEGMNKGRQSIGQIE